MEYFSAVQVNNMMVLGIETSASLGSVALLDTIADRIIGDISMDIHTGHSEKIVPFIDFILNETGISIEDIELVAVSMGPGSFAGLRVGISSAKGIALSLDVPVVGVDSLMGCVYSHLLLFDRVGAIFDAKRGEVYGAAYCSKDEDIPEILIEPNIFEIDDFIDNCVEMEIDTFAGDVYREDIRKSIPERSTLPEKGFEKPNALSIAMLGHIIYSKHGEDNINDLSPRYLRKFIPGKPR